MYLEVVPDRQSHVNRSRTMRCNSCPTHYETGVSASSDLQHRPRHGRNPSNLFAGWSGPSGMSRKVEIVLSLGSPAGVPRRQELTRGSESTFNSSSQFQHKGMKSQARVVRRTSERSHSDHLVADSCSDLDRASFRSKFCPGSDGQSHLFVSAEVAFS